MNFATMLLTPIAPAPIRRRKSAEEREKAGRKAGIPANILAEMHALMAGKKQTTYEIANTVGEPHKKIHRRLLRLEEAGYARRAGTRQVTKAAKPHDVWVWIDKDVLP